jgi:hypothetical protein
MTTTGPAIRLGEITIASVVEIGRSSFPTASMLPDSTPDAVAVHHAWLKPHFFDDTTGDLASRIQTFVVRTPRHTVLIDTCVGGSFPLPETRQSCLSSSAPPRTQRQ